MSLSKIFAKPFFVAILLWFFLLGGAYIAVDFFILPSLAGQFKKTAPVPEVIGFSVDEAEKKLNHADLKMMLDSGGDYSQDIPAGRILSQFPLPGGVVKEGRRVWVKVSKGYRAVTIPPLRGLSLRQAEISLQQAGLTPGKVAELPHASIPAGAVIGTVPVAGAKVEQGKVVDIHLSLGTQSEPTRLPALRGMSLAQAKLKLEKLNLTLGEVETRKDSRSLPGTVLDQKPAAGAPLQGQTVDLIISK